MWSAIVTSLTMPSADLIIKSGQAPTDSVAFVGLQRVCSCQTPVCTWDLSETFYKSRSFVLDSLLETWLKKECSCLPYLKPWAFVDCRWTNELSPIQEWGTLGDSCGINFFRCGRKRTTVNQWTMTQNTTKCLDILVFSTGVATMLGCPSSWMHSGSGHLRSWECIRCCVFGWWTLLCSGIAFLVTSHDLEGFVKW